MKKVPKRFRKTTSQQHHASLAVNSENSSVVQSVCPEEVLSHPLYYHCLKFKKKTKNHTPPKTTTQHNPQTQTATSKLSTKPLLYPPKIKIKDKHTQLREDSLLWCVFEDFSITNVNFCVLYSRN